MKESFICPVCGNETMFGSDKPYCHKCLSELGRKPLAQMSETRCKYELNIIAHLSERDQERFADHKNQVEKRLFQIQTGH